MGQTIKLIIYYFAYQFALIIPGVIGYIIYEYSQTGEIISPDKSIPVDFALILGLIATLLMTRHLLHFGYIKIDRRNMAPGSGKVICTYVLMGIASIVWMGWINELVDLPDWNKNLFLQMKDNVFGILTACIVAPIFEELFFRGVIEDHLLRRWKNPKYAILVSAIIFGVIHGNPAQIVFAFMFGLILGELYYRTGSLMPGIILHFINNAFSTIMMNLYPEETTLTELIGEYPTLIAAAVSIGAFAILFLRLKKEIKAPDWKEEQELAI